MSNERARGVERSARLAALLCASVGFLNACSGSVKSTDDQAPETPAANEVPCLSGSGVNTLYAEYVTGFAIADDQVVLAAGDGVRRVPLAGGEAVLLAPTSDPGGPLVLNGMAYFVAMASLEAVPVNGGDVTAVLDAGNTPTLTSATNDAGSLYFSTSSLNGIGRFTPPSSYSELSTGEVRYIIDALTVYGDYVYIAAQDAGSSGAFNNGLIQRLPKNGGQPENLVTGIGHPWHVVADATGLYWQEDPMGITGNGHIAHAKLDGTGVGTLLADATVRALALHAGQLFFSTGDTISSISVAGGALTTIVSGQKAAGALAVSGQNLVWIDPSERALSDPTVPQVLTACAP